MRVTVSVMGRFHAFNLANHLNRKGHLLRLITTYPKFETVKYGIPRSRIISHLPIELFRRAWNYSPSSLRQRLDAQLLIHNLVDLSASHRIPDNTDVFVGWSSVSLWSLRRAKRQGAVTVLDRGSSHMRYQRHILLEEYERCGLKPQVVHPGVYEKEIKEYEEADYICVPSSFAKRTFLDCGVAENKLIHVPLGVDLGEFKPFPKQDKVFRIIHCGALCLRKGVHYLLKAFFELGLPDAELWLIGAMTDEISGFLRKYDNGRVFHKGPYAQRELYRYYSQGSVFCLASIEEGMAMVIPQAMACGLPVICSTNTGGEDLVRNGQDGFVIPIRDVLSLKESLLRLYEDPILRNAMALSAQERVSQGFGWNHYGERMVTSYRNIAQR